MKAIFILLLLFINNPLTSFAQKQERRFTKENIQDKYIPTDLQDCFKQLDKFWDDSIKNEAKAMKESEFTAKGHFGVGLWMRNNWHLWKGSRLSKYFNGIGIFHPDDMSGIILTSYYRHLKGVDLDLQSQIKFYQDYWKQQKHN